MATFSPQVHPDQVPQIKLMTIDGTRAALQHLNRNLPGAAFLGLINREMGICPEREF